MVIKNKEQLATSGIRKDAIEIIEAAFEAVIPKKAIQNKVRLNNNFLKVNDSRYNLNDYENIYIIGFGKSSSLMCQEIENILGDKITGGVVTSTKEVDLKRTKFYLGTHPFPSEQNIEATKKIVEIVRKATEKDLILCLISGGGSALLFYPNIPFKEYNKKIKDVFASGIDIFELNKIRKQLSNVKDGKLAKMTKAKIVSLIFSDVIGDDLATIASGPTYSKEGLSNVDNHLLLTNKVALKAMETKAKELRYKTKVVTNTLDGEAKEAAGKLIEICNGEDAECYLFAGETTVKVKGDGIGGRNQEFCLASIDKISGEKDYVVASAGTDGIDGPNNDAAGAIVCNKSLNRCKEKGLDFKQFLENNDSYNFFKKMGDLIKTGVTGSNVADVGVIIKKA